MYNLKTIGFREKRVKFWTEMTDTLKKLKEMSLKYGTAKAAFQILISKPKEVLSNRTR